jgi:hypothetical protein
MPATISTDERVQQLADDISKFVNSISQSHIAELGVALTHDHRTLIQSKMRFVLAFLKELDNLYVHKFYDARNEAACKLANKMLANLNEMDTCLPFI